MSIVWGVLTEKVALRIKDNDYAPLDIATEIFKVFEDHGIRYCHFKSNKHLLSGLVGDTDLDVLIDRKHASEVAHAFAATGFKRFSSKFSSSYPAVEDYLGFDERTGRLLHLHLHYELIVGQRHLKQYRLPWEEEILSTRIKDKGTGLYIAEPHREMLLLLVRYALKLRLRDYFAAAIGRPYFRGDFQKEWHWLRPRCQKPRLLQIARAIIDEQGAEIATSMLVGKVTFLSLLKLRKVAARPHVAVRSYGRIQARTLRFVREAFWAAGGLNKRSLNLPVPFRRVNPRGGIVIAVLGTDGSGKSTVTTELHRWLSWKLDSYRIYFGSGDGSSSWIRTPLVLTRKLWMAHVHSRKYDGNKQAQVAGAARATKSAEERRRSLAGVIWALSLALEKRTKMIAAMKARNQGMVVITDRYPQAVVPGISDGPLLRFWENERSSVKRHLAEFESAVYRLAQNNAPDLVVKLQVSAETAGRRRPEMPRARIDRRIEVIGNVTYENARASVYIDANRGFPEVLRDIKRAVWAQL